MDFGEVGFRSNTTVVEQVLTKGISMFVSESLDGLVMVKFQMSLVVVSKSQLEVLNPGAEGSGGQGWPSMS